MRFAFEDDQVLLRDAVRDLLAKECPPEEVRRAWDPGLPLDRHLWDRLVDMGVTAVTGEMGLDERSLVLLLEETGYAAVPYPIAETAAVAAPLLGPDLDGRMASTDLGGPLVPAAAESDLLLLRAGDGALHAVDPGASTVEPADAVDRAGRVARVQWEPTPATLLTDDPAVVALAFDRGVLAAAAQLAGLAQRMLDLAVDHVTSRHQFGVPIGSFQAVKHHLADAALHLEFTRPAVYRAAWSIATDDPDRSRHVSIAKFLAGRTADLVGRAALQCHGAIGYTVEYDLHLYLKRAWALTRRWGDPAWHRRRVGAAIGVIKGEA